jgi:hypothetical protein
LESSRNYQSIDTLKRPSRFYFDRVWVKRALPRDSHQDKSSWDSPVVSDRSNTSWMMELTGTRVVGDTISTSFPTTPGAFDTLPNTNENTDVFVTKLNAAGVKIPIGCSRTTTTQASRCSVEATSRSIKNENAVVTASTWTNS